MKFIFGTIIGIIFTVLTTLFAVSTAWSIFSFLGLAKLATAFGTKNVTRVVFTPYDKIVRVDVEDDGDVPEPDRIGFW